MRFSLSLVILLAGLMLSGPAQAGKVSNADGRSQWLPTGCVKPVAPQAMSGNPEAAASDVNATVTAHNAYVEAVQGYMDCVSQEAQHDADAFGQLITSSAQEIINQSQQDVAASAARAHTKPAVQ